MKSIISQIQLFTEVNAEVSAQVNGGLSIDGMTIYPDFGVPDPWRDFYCNHGLLFFDNCFTDYFTQLHSIENWINYFNT